jgi:hypothetical protein
MRKICVAFFFAQISWKFLAKKKMGEKKQDLVTRVSRRNDHLWTTWNWSFQDSSITRQSSTGTNFF